MTWARRGLLGVEDGDRPSRDESGHVLDGLSSGGVESTVSPVACHGVDELLTRVSHVPGDDMQQVRCAASGHADIHPGGTDALGQDRVGAGGGDALDSVGGRRVRQVRVLAHILNR